MPGRGLYVAQEERQQQDRDRRRRRPPRRATTGSRSLERVDKAGRRRPPSAAGLMRVAATTAASSSADVTATSTRPRISSAPGNTWAATIPASHRVAKPSDARYAAQVPGTSGARGGRPPRWRPASRRRKMRLLGTRSRSRRGQSSDEELRVAPVEHACEGIDAEAERLERETEDSPPPPARRELRREGRRAIEVEWDSHRAVVGDLETLVLREPLRGIGREVEEVDRAARGTPTPPSCGRAGGRWPAGTSPRRWGT